MPESVMAARLGLNMALVYTLPFFLWLLGQSYLSRTGSVEIAISLQGMMATLLLLQSCILAACLPWMMRFSLHRDRCYGVAMLVLVPAPLYAISWLTGAAQVKALVLAMASLVGIGMLLYGLYTACLIVAAPGQQRSLLIRVLQVALVGFCWNYREVWQQVLSL
jgi:hypothetical protein